MKLPFIQTDNNNTEVEMIPVNKIKPNPFQPRIEFNRQDLEELAESIKNFGVVQPLTVRKREDWYELIAGERRLRATKLLGYNEIPAIVRKYNDQEMAEIALVENLQRKDLDFLEEAQAYKKLIDEFGFTQRELAEKIGKSQSTVANKLRILNLPTDVCNYFSSPLITERHARALLKLEKKEEQVEVVKKIIKEELTVKETEKLIDSKINKKTNKNKVITLYKDLRLFTNTLNKTIKEMKTAGIDLKVEKEDKDDYIEYKILFPKKKI